MSNLNEVRAAIEFFKRVAPFSSPAEVRRHQLVLCIFLAEQAERALLPQPQTITREQLEERLDEQREAILLHAKERRY